MLLIENIGQLREYATSLFYEVPMFVYEMLLCIFCIGLIILVVWKGKKIFHLLSWLLLVEYSLLLYSSTFFFRETQGERLFRFELLWSYSAPSMIPENIMNVVVFIPIGLLLGIVLQSSWFKAHESQKKQNRIRNVWLISIGIGLLMSLSIEALQFTFKRGSCDVDDIINNTLGAMIGATFWLVARVLWLKRMR